MGNSIYAITTPQSLDPFMPVRVLKTFRTLNQTLEWFTKTGLGDVFCYIEIPLPDELIGVVEKVVE